jgi:hypothetical protein
VNDGQGGSDTEDLMITVNPTVVEVLERIELDGAETLSGSGTQADPWVVTDDFELQLRAFSNEDNDWTDLANWSDSSNQPGTAFSGTAKGKLFASPFDSNFNVSAELDGTTITVYFRVQAPI